MNIFLMILSVLCFLLAFFFLITFSSVLLVAVAFSFGITLLVIRSFLNKMETTNDLLSELIDHVDTMQVKMIEVINENQKIESKETDKNG